MKLLQIILITVVLLGISPLKLKGQVIQIGTGTQENTITQASPVNTYYRRQVAQFVYTVSELNTAGVTTANIISQLGFYVTTNPLYDIPGYTIKIKHTNQNNVNTALGTTGWTTVKTAFNYSPTPGGYDMIVFDVPFNWNGTQNIGVEICWSQVQPNWDASGQCRVFTSNKGYRYSRDDNTGSICGTSPTTRVNIKPQVQLVFKTTSTWIGNVNSDWNNDNNWDIGTPDSTLHAQIPSNSINMPQITTTAKCKNIQIDVGANLSLIGNSKIEVFGNWLNNGTFNPDNGNVIFKGKSANSIDGVNNQVFYDLTIDNINGAIINSGSIDLKGTLNIAIATGNFITNNSLTLISDASGTARINELTTKCLYTLDMSDSYGDSWNGGYISVYVDGALVGDFFAKGSNSTNNFIAPTGSSIRLDYTAGIYEWENSYILYDGSGNNLFSDGPTPSTGSNVFSTTANCSFFNPISGNITMQRYIDAGATDWRFLTSAVSGATLGDLSSSFITSGFTGSDFPNWPSTANPWPSIYFYDETQPGISDSGFYAATNITNVIGVGQGIWVWSGDTIIGTQPFTIDVTGPPNVGDINLPITYTNSGLPDDDGWNMVGNPYPSSIDWDSPNITKTNINNAIYIWNPDLQQFGSYVGGIGTNGASNNIASSQAFWVQANAPSPIITVTEAAKTPIDAPFLKPANASLPLKIKATNNYGTDEIAINFENNATNNFDALYDAEKMSSVNTNLPRIASIINNIEYSINQLPEQEINIPIKITTNVAGLQQLSFENVSSFANVSCLILEDLFTGSNYDLYSSPTITTYIYDTTTVARFLLHIGAPYNILSNDISCYGNNDASISFTKNTANPFDIVWKDSGNNIISSATSVFADTLTNLSQGNYFIETTDLYCGNKIDTVTITEPSPITSYYTITADTFNIGDIFSPINQSLNALSYEWNFGDGNISTAFSPTHTYTQGGNYFVNLKASQSVSCFKNYNKLITIINNATNINESVSKNNIKSWINNELLYVNLNNKHYQTIQLRNSLGQLVYTQAIQKDLFTIDMSNLSNGIYFVSLVNASEKPYSFSVILY